MKKLITMIGAVAAAFGLYAAEPAEMNIIGFESGDAGMPETVPGELDIKATQDDYRLWFTEEPEPEEELTKTVTAYTGAEGEPTDAGDNYLAIETGDYPLYRTVAPVDTVADPEAMQPVDIAENGGIVADQIVQFTPFYEAPTEFAAGTKLAVWLKATDAEDENPGEPNLYVTCGSMDLDYLMSGSRNIKVTLPSGKKILPKSWHKLTITGIIAADYTGVIVPGFTVAIDGEEVVAEADDLFPEDYADYATVGAKKLIAAQKLFPSMVSFSEKAKNPTSITAVGFSGSGSIDELEITQGNKYEVAARIGTLPTGVELDKVTDLENNEITAVGGAYIVAAGDQIKIWFKAAPGYKLTGETSVTALASKNIAIDPEVVTAVLAETPFAIIIVDGQTATTNYYNTLTLAIEAAGTDNLPNEVTIMKSETLNATVTIAKSVAINLNGKTLTFAADLQKGITAKDVQGVITISNGNFAVASGRANIANSIAVDLVRTSAEFKDVTIDVPGFEYALSHMGNIAEGRQDDNRNEYWTIPTQYTLDCDNVQVKGNGSLFHLEYVRANLDDKCLAEQYDDKGYFANAAHAAAIYSSCGANVTVEGGTYTAKNALQTGNLGGIITVKDGKFNGDIMSYMYAGDTRYDDNEASIEIVGGTFNGDFAYATGQKGPCTKDEVTWNIKGGSFADDPTEYLAAGYKAVEGDNVWTVEAKKFYDITFKVEGQADYVTNVVEGTEVATVAPANPEKTGYTFTGWNPALAGDVTAAATYTAQFEAIPTYYCYAEVYVDGKLTELKAAPGDGDHKYAAGSTVALTNDAVIINPAYLAPATGTWYISKIVDADSNEATFTYNGETFAIEKSAIDGLAYDATTGKVTYTLTTKGGKDGEEKLGAIYLTKYEAAPDFPVDDDKELDDNGKAAVETAKTVFGADLNTYVAAVYGEGGKIPAEALNATTDDLIAIAKEYNLPILTTEAEVKAAQVATGFTFQIVDGEPVELLAPALEKMIKYSADLTAFGANADQIGLAVSDDKKTIEATFKKPNNEAKGFMKLELAVPAAE